MPTTAVSPGLTLLGGDLDHVALVSGTDRVSYGELADRVDERRAELGEGRRLVMLQAANAVEPIVTYLAALAGGHPVLLVAPGEDEGSIRHRVSLADRFDPKAYTDQYRVALEELIERKTKGEKRNAKRRKPAPKVIDLMEALQASVAEAKKGGSGKRSSAKDTKKTTRRKARRAA